MTTGIGSDIWEQGRLKKNVALWAGTLHEYWGFELSGRVGSATGNLKSRDLFFPKTLGKY
jgi:hypothetical protein